MLSEFNSDVISISVGGICAALLYLFFKLKSDKEGTTIQTNIKGFSMKYHYFEWWFLIPTRIIRDILNYKMYEDYTLIFPTNIFLFVLFINIVLNIISFVGYFKLKKYSWYTTIISRTLSFVDVLIFVIVFNYNDSMAASKVFDSFLQNIFVLVYYFKRKDVFNEISESNATIDSIEYSREEFVENNDILSEQIDNNIEPNRYYTNNTLEKQETMFCRYCGKEIPTDSDYCQYCGSKLMYDNKNNTKNFTYFKNVLQNKMIYKTFLIALAAIAVMFSIVVFTKRDNSTSLTFRDGEIVESRNMQYNKYKTYLIKYAIDIEAPSNENVYVLIRNSKVNEKNKYVSFLIKNNSHFKIYLPKGSYELFFATGKDWYGKDNKFGMNTKYYYHSSVLYTDVLDENQYWVIDFEPLDKELVRIKKKDFPDY